MRENRQYGSEGGEDYSLPYPYLPKSGRTARAWLSRATYDDARRRSKAFHRFDPLLKPPAILRCPVLEATVDAEIVRPVMCDVGVVLRLAADRDEIGLTSLEDGLGLLRLENDANGHRGDVRLLADPLRERNLEAETARHLRCRCRTRDAA